MNKKYLIIGGVALGIGALIYYNNKKSKENSSKATVPNEIGNGSSMPQNLRNMYKRQNTEKMIQNADIIDDVQLGSETMDELGYPFPKKIDINKIQKAFVNTNKNLLVLDKYIITNNSNKDLGRGVVILTNIMVSGDPYSNTYGSTASYDANGEFMIFDRQNPYGN